MSILIKGMEMPQEGSWKTVCIYPNGTCDVPNWQGDCTLIQGAKAVPVPPHGDLIDRSQISGLLDKDRHDRNIYQLVWNDAINTVIQTMPTIIDAEGGKT